jgi:hypothetical protein
METDQADMLGHFQLIEKNGVTVTDFQKGLVIEAMERGAILLLDELDAGQVNKLLTLQSILEGKGVFLKEINEYINPKPGFNIIATANTKGRGSEDGRYLGTNIVNSAFLDRFCIMLEQSFFNDETEYKILEQYYLDYIFIQRGILANEITKNDAKEAKKFLVKLCNWSKQIRMTYINGGIEEFISTRTLISIIKAYGIFLDKTEYNFNYNIMIECISMACERYPKEIKDSFLEIFVKLFDESMTEPPKLKADVDENIPF